MMNEDKNELNFWKLKWKIVKINFFLNKKTVKFFSHKNFFQEACHKIPVDTLVMQCQKKSCEKTS